MLNYTPVGRALQGFYQARPITGQNSSDRKIYSVGAGGDPPLSTALVRAAAERRTLSSQANPITLLP
ncbi:MAG: hypothetical protein LBR16_02730 [Treponema sp.]|jgi:hypothetical protein|nr:hypothetical protein [Treponema sp.]